MAEAVFKDMHSKLVAAGDEVKQVGGVYQWDIKTGSGVRSWTMDCKTSPGVQEGAANKADCVLSLAEEDFLALVAGNLNAQQAFMQGKLKLKGNMAMAMKLGSVMEAARSAAPTAGSGFASDIVFAELAKRVSTESSLVQQVNAVYHWVIKGANGATKDWTVDLKNGSGSVVEGKPASADCTITVADADYVALVTGQAKPQQLFMQGKLKLKGNMALAMKLDKLVSTARSKL